MLARLRALEILQGWVGKTEVGGNNRGPFVEMIQRADGLRQPDIGYAWCQSTQNAAWRLATGGRIQRVNGRDEIAMGSYLADGTASVGLFVSWARANGYIVTRPLKGDHVAFQFTADAWPDHVGMVEKVLQLGAVLILQTIEGNTSPDDGGSQADGGGIFRRRRVVRANKVVFVRVPGVAVLPRPEWRFDVKLGKPGRRRLMGTAKLADLDELIESAARRIQAGESIRVDRRKVLVWP